MTRDKFNPISDRVREIFLEEDEISPYDLFKRVKKEFGGVYKVTKDYKVFYRQYIYFPRVLGLIKRVGSKKKLRGESKGGFEKVYYRLLHPDSPMWSNPQKYYNPLISLGSKRYSTLKTRADESEMHIVDTLFEVYPETVEEVARERGMTPAEFKKWLKKRTGL